MRRNHQTGDGRHTFQCHSAIRAHLIENLSIDQEDFEAIPILANAGGWKRADKIFEGDLSKVIRSLNEAVAA